MKFQYLLTLSILVTTSLMASLAHGSFDSDCKFAYRGSAVDLIAKIMEFKDAKITGPDLGISAAAIDVKVSALRAACYFKEPAENRICVNKYEKVYQAVKAKVDSGALISGKQKEVDYSGLENAIVHAKIQIDDIQCDF